MDPCSNVACGQNEICTLGSSRVAMCKCAEDFIRNPATKNCEKPSLPDCKTNSDCALFKECIPDQLGVMKCVEVCLSLTCPQNAVCVANGHNGHCQCKEGFTGNTNNRNGCVPTMMDQCTQDAQCQESEMCVKEMNGASVCKPACEYMQCGPNAVCVTKNHVGQCQCEQGRFVGDPNDLTTGCRPVSCIYNTDCPVQQACNRMNNTCLDVCDRHMCGKNAVCIATDHSPNCQCPQGYVPNPNPEVECTLANLCEPNPCHISAKCESTPTGYICKCRGNQVGDPITTGCHAEGACPNGDTDCPEQSACQGGRCINPCDKACGPNTMCTVKNRKPVCSCPKKFKIHGLGFKAQCVRMAVECTTDVECSGDICIDGECRGITFVYLIYVNIIEIIFMHGEEYYYYLFQLCAALLMIV
jgi:hypothetical protein